MGRITTKEQHTRRLTEQRLRDRIFRATDKLLLAQMALALGTNYLMHTKTINKGKKNERRETIQVEDIQTIIDYLNGELDNDQDNYFFVTTKDPNPQAIESLWNRAFGRPVESHRLVGEDGEDRPTGVIIYMPQKLPEGYDGLGRKTVVPVDNLAKPTLDKPVDKVEQNVVDNG